MYGDKDTLLHPPDTGKQPAATFSMIYGVRFSMSHEQHPRLVKDMVFIPMLVHVHSSLVPPKKLHSIPTTSSKGCIN